MFKKISKNLLPLAVITAGLLVIGTIIFINIKKCPGQFTSENKGSELSSQKVGKKVVDFINNEMLGGKAAGTLTSISRENGMYKVSMNIQGKKYDLYSTLDGKFLYPEKIDMDKIIAQKKGEASKTTKKTCQDIKKSDKPLMEVFVVSNCPYGLQTQRILAEIWKNIPSLIDNVKVRYIGSISNDKIISMHGDKEAQENLRQICIREEEPNKYWDYMSCYIKKGDTDGCLKSVDINADKLNSCTTDSSRGLKYAQEDFDLENKYQVTGSPTLIVNGEKASEFDFGGRTAEAVKTLLCCGFKNSPDFCSKKLTTDSAATSFSEGYSSGSAGANGNCQ